MNQWNCGKELWNAFKGESDENVTYRSINVIHISESEHNNSDEESTDIDEHRTQSDDIENSRNSINTLSIKKSENIENAKECGKEMLQYIWWYKITKN